MWKFNTTSNTWEYLLKLESFTSASSALWAYEDLIFSFGGVDQSCIYYTNFFVFQYNTNNSLDGNHTNKLLQFNTSSMEYNFIDGWTYNGHAIYESNNTSVLWPSARLDLFFLK